MNERIKELAYKAGLHNHLWLDIPDSDDVLDTVKFAELIVRECARIGELKEQGYEDYDPNLSVGWYMKQYFGVEE